MNAAVKSLLLAFSACICVLALPRTVLGAPRVTTGFCEGSCSKTMPTCGDGWTCSLTWTSIVITNLVDCEGCQVACNYKLKCTKPNQPGWIVFSSANATLLCGGTISSSPGCPPGAGGSGGTATGACSLCPCN